MNVVVVRVLTLWKTPIVWVENCTTRVGPNAALERVCDGIGRDGAVAAQKYKPFLKMLKISSGTDLVKVDHTTNS